MINSIKRNLLLKPEYHAVERMVEYFLNKKKIRLNIYMTVSVFYLPSRLECRISSHRLR